MDCWIVGSRDDLNRLLKKIDCLIINDDEAKILANEHNLIKAIEAIMDMGPSIVVIKKGEYGSMLCSNVARASCPCKHGQDGRATKLFILPAYPAADVKDPTGAGDSFAGAFMGYLAQADRTDFESLKQALAYGTVVASFTIAEFSLAGLTSISRADIDDRLKTLWEMTQF
jgi:sugar/nucleoside kinase (ribokinase family)